MRFRSYIDARGFFQSRGKFASEGALLSLISYLKGQIWSLDQPDVDDLILDIECELDARKRNDDLKIKLGDHLAIVVNEARKNEVFIKLTPDSSTNVLSNSKKKSLKQHYMRAMAAK